MPNQQALQTRRADMPLVGVQMEIRNVARAAASGGDSATTDAAATFELVFTTGAPVRRYDWANGRYYFEQLEVSKAAIDLSRLQRGAPLLNTHNAWSLEDQIGVVDQPAISNGQGTVQAQLSRRDSVRGIVQDLEDRVIRNVSVGYVRNAMTQSQDANGVWTYTVTSWTPQEVSLVPIPADMDSQVRSVDGRLQDAAGVEIRSYPCEITEAAPASNQFPPTVGITAATSPETRKEVPMPQENAGGTTATTVPATPAVQTAAPTQVRSEVEIAIARSADITDLCQRNGTPELAVELIRSGKDMLDVRSAIAAELARRDAGQGGNRNVSNVVTTVRDEMQTRMAGIEQAIANRVDARAQLDDNGRQYRGMSLLEIGREYLSACGINTRGMDRMVLAGHMLSHRSAGMLTTSDFGSIFANVANKRLRGTYDENPGTYTIWARRAPNAPDFKTMTVAQLSGAPDLLKTNEAGEFTFGSMSDGSETYGVLTYGRIVPLSRQAIVNDDLRAFERLVTAFGFAARRLENRLVYAQLTANANLSDGVALFHANHANLGTGAGSALQFSALTTARTAMRTQKGLQQEELNLAPSYLIVPAALEQTAYQLTSSQYVPAKQSDVNEFRAGGRTSLEPVIEPILDAASATAWYLAAQTSQVDTVEFCYLDGAEGPVIDSEIGFEQDGISYKCRLDFAAKALDYRGLYKANGA